MQFKKFPVFLFSYRELSSDAKILYSLMLDRKSLSEKNGWVDENGTYIVFKLEEVDDFIPSSKSKASNLMKELRDCGLISVKRLGQGNANRIYVTELSTDEHTEGSDNELKSSENETQKFTEQPPKETDDINTKYNNYLSVTVSNTIQTDRTEHIAENAGLYDFPDDPVNALLVDIIREVMTGDGNECVRINGMNKPKDILRSCFMKIDRDTISHFYYRLANHTDLKAVKNKRSYLRSMLYNAYFEGAFQPESQLKYGT